MLAPKGAYPGFPGTAHADIRNPMVELPVNVNTLLDADAIIVTHTHDDHWDRTAVELIAKDKPIYVQNDSDAALLTRRALREYAQANQFSDALSIPQDGETVIF